MSVKYFYTCKIGCAKKAEKGDRLYKLCCYNCSEAKYCEISCTKTGTRYYAHPETCNSVVEKELISKVALKFFSLWLIAFIIGLLILIIFEAPLYKELIK